MNNSKKTSKRGKRGLGRLYKRDSKGKEHPPSSKVKGTFYVDYTIKDNNGKSKRIRKKLIDENNIPVTDLNLAKELYKKVITPFLLKSEKEKLLELEAKIKKTDELVEIANEKTKHKITFNEVWSYFLKSQSRSDPSPPTLVNYERHLRKFYSWLTESHPNIFQLEKVSHNLASEYALFLTESGLSNNTYNKRIGFLKLLYNTLIIDELLPEQNPFSKIKRKEKLKTSSKKPLTVEQVITLITNAKGDLRVLFVLGYFTALRRGDCCTLKWEEIHLDRRIILRIPNKIKTRSDNPKLVKIGISDDLFSMLLEIPSTNRTGYLLPEIAELYFDKNKRHRITRMINKHFKDCNIQIHAEGTGSGTGKRAITEYGFHSLRYSYITQHAEAGTSQALIQDNVAHSNPGQTQAYVKKSDRAAVETANKLSLSKKKVTIKEQVITTINKIEDESFLKKLLEFIKEKHNQT